MPGSVAPEFLKDSPLGFLTVRSNSCIFFKAKNSLGQHRFAFPPKKCHCKSGLEFAFSFFLHLLFYFIYTLITSIL